MKRLFCFLLITVCTIQPLQKTPIIACTLDLLTEEEDPEKTAELSISEGYKLFQGRTGLGLKLWWNRKSIKRRGQELAKSMPGVANVTRKILEDYHGITEDDIRTLTKIAVNPILKQTGIELFTVLRKTYNFSVIGIANHDPVHHHIFREKVKHAVDLNELLHGIIMVPYEGDPLETAQDFCIHQSNVNWYLARSNCKNSCYKALSALADTIDKDAPIIVIQKKKDDEIRIPRFFSDRVERIVFESVEQIEKILQKKGFIKKY